MGKFWGDLRWGGKVPPIISGTGKAMNFKFCLHVHRIGKSSHEPWAYSGTAEIFWAPIYRVHRAVIFAVAQRSCYQFLRYPGRISTLFTIHCLFICSLAHSLIADISVVWCVRIIQNRVGVVVVKAVDDDHSLSHVNPTARTALYQPHKDKPLTSPNTCKCCWLIGLKWCQARHPISNNM